MYKGSEKENRMKMNIGLRKQIATKTNGCVTECPRESFKDVYKKVKGQNVEIWLQKYNVHEIGETFDSETFLGNAKDKLTQDDYWNAYDRLY